MSKRVQQAFPDFDVKVTKDQVQVWRSLKAMTEGEARKIVVGVREEDGFAAWYSLHRRFEPALQNRQGIALTELNKLLLHPAKTPGDMRTLLTTLEEKMKMVEDITKEKVGPSHAKSILIGLLDPITRQHTAMIQGVNTGYHALKDAVMTFTNNAVGLQGTGGGGLGSVQEHPGDGGCGGPGGGDYEHQDGGEGYLGAFGKGVKCYNCQDFGHIARNCPAKGKGKSGQK